jgi:hypothetical protein
MHNQKNYNMYSFESKEDKDNRMANTIVSQLSSLIYNMISFGMPLSDVQNIVVNFSKYYDLDENKTDGLLRGLDEFSMISKAKESEIKSQPLVEKDNVPSDEVGEIHSIEKGSNEEVNIDKNKDS